MTYDFDEVIERRGTNSLKFDFARERGRPEDILPLWVADMDFLAPPAVTEALVRASHGIFGYSEAKDAYFDAVRAWFARGFEFELQPEWLVKSPGVVFALATAVRAFTEPGGAVLILSPVYYPFSEVVLDNGRRLARSSLVYTDGAYRVDFADFERKLTKSGATLFLLCSPHNPVGRVWTRAELTRLGEICLRHGCVVVSDEIHCDFVFDGHRHHIFGSLSPAFLDGSVLCTAPSKTFNLAGLQISNIFIANPALREKFTRELARTGYSQMNTMGLIACQAAYEHGEDWLLQLRAYLAGNLAYLRDFLRARLPSIKLVEPEGTYLVWLDFRALGLTQDALEERITHKARLWLDAGTIFGPEGAGFERVNIACPRKTLQAALERLERAFTE
ncbi:MAG: pyridoxal phosphate-dependent aminotransferase [Oscillospiraceae bacterium]|jgi:cystathionine beta-lyase|nr:pyridoxal phosphate-dependent aminotransferase [Oscillospiraceae bacterium]